MKAVQQLGPKAVGFHLETGDCLWYIIRCYLVPDNTSTIESVVAFLKERPRGDKLLVSGDLNVNLADLEGDRREEETSAALMAAVLEYMFSHFLPQRISWF